MKLDFIGTGSIGAQQMSASTLIDNEILIDMPNGVIKKMKQLEHDISEIKVILITHLHGDHFLDIPFLMLEKFFNKINGKTKIYCPAGTQAKVKQIFEIAFPGDYDFINSSIDIEFIEFEELINENILEDTYVDSKMVEHGKLKNAYGYVIKKGNKSIGFSGDSKLCRGVEEIIEQSDISVLDMSLPEDGNAGHMSLNEIEELCEKNKSKILVATHMQDLTRKKAKERNIKNLIIPDDGQTFNDLD